MQDKKGRSLLLNMPRYIICGMLSTIVFSVFARILLRNFYRFLSFDETFFSIFQQISSEETKITSPILLLFILSFLMFILLVLLWKKGMAFKVLAVFLGLLCFLALLMASVLFTKVNEVMFFDVIRSLIPLLKEGVL